MSSKKKTLMKNTIMLYILTFSLGYSSYLFLMECQAQKNKDRANGYFSFHFS